MRIHILGIWSGFDKTNVSLEHLGSRLKQVGSCTQFLDNLGLLGPVLCFVILDTNIFTRIYFSRRVPWSLFFRLTLHPPPSAKVLLCSFSVPLGPSGGGFFFRFGGFSSASSGRFLSLYRTFQSADFERLLDLEPVSYTHLTLPTNREV